MSNNNDGSLAMRIGIDLGGTKIEGICQDSTGAEVARIRLNTPRGDYNNIVNQICHCINLLKPVESVDYSVGIGTPGSIDPHRGLMRNANSTELNGRNLKMDLEQRLGQSVRLANDANCFALSEAVDGAGQGHRMVFGVILGTGVGGGLVVDGRLHHGKNLLGGEWGHNPLPWVQHSEIPGPACYCGLTGCLETWLSGPALAGSYNSLHDSQLDSVAISTLASSGDQAAQLCLLAYANRLARSLAQVINLLDPDVIVLGGGMSRIGTLYSQVPELWEQWVFADHISTPLLPAVHGDSSGVRGAAWLWP